MRRHLVVERLSLRLLCYVPATKRCLQSNLTSSQLCATALHARLNRARHLPRAAAGTGTGTGTGTRGTIQLTRPSSRRLSYLPLQLTSSDISQVRPRCAPVAAAANRACCNWPVTCPSLHVRSRGRRVTAMPVVAARRGTAYGCVQPDALGIRRPQYSLNTVGGRASKSASQGRSDDFILRQANPC
jgi:hypothetical protein